MMDKGGVNSPTLVFFYRSVIIGYRNYLVRIRQIRWDTTISILQSRKGKSWQKVRMKMNLRLDIKKQKNFKIIHFS